MTKAASTAVLQELHATVAKSLKNRIEQDIADDLPTDAATLGAAIKFLKDNNISADPAASDDLSELRDKLKAQADLRRQNMRNVVNLAERDLKQMEG